MGKSKKICCLALAFGMALSLCVPSAAQGDAAAQPQLSARRAVLLNADTGELLYGHNEHEKASMASTTKIMTALLAVERGEPNAVVTATDRAVRIEGTSIGLKAGDKITLKTLVYGMLLESGNDAANVTAQYIAGSNGKFAQLMNARAKELGMQHTNFVTPSGLDDAQHYSTAYDMALLGAAAIRNPEFLAACSAQKARVAYGDPQYARTFSNHNRLLSMYDGALGIKTGFTKKSGRCLVSAARRDGITLVAVTLNDPNDWDDHVKLFDYGFRVTQKHAAGTQLPVLQLKVTGGDTALVAVKAAYTREIAVPQEKADCKVYLEPFCYAPVAKGRVVGRAVYTYQGKILCEIPLVTDGAAACTTQEQQPRQKPAGFWARIKAKWKTKE